MTLGKLISKIFTIAIKRLFRKNCTQIIIPTNKYKMLVPDDLIWAYPNGDYYEDNVIYFLDRIVKSYTNPIMLDAGANCGYYSLRYATLCKEIYSFEPVSKTFEMLSLNLNRNNIKNIIPSQSGLSDISGDKVINLYNSSGNNSIFERQVPEGHSLKKVGNETIHLNSLDTLVELGKVAIPDIIKIDVEGAELQVLKGAKKTITICRPTVLLEYSESTSVDAGYNKESLISILELNNYCIYGIPEYEKDFTLIKQKDFDKRNIANLIFIPNEKDDFFTDGIG